MATDDASWYGDDSQVSQIRGRLFEAVCLVATSVGLVSVLILLLYVAGDAFQPFTGDPSWALTVPTFPVLGSITLVIPGWQLVFFVTLVLPVALLVGYYYRVDSLAGEVAYITTGLPIVGLLLAGSLFVIYAELFSIKAWFATVLSLAAAGVIVYAHRRYRPDAAVERLALTVLAPVVLVLGVPPVSLARLVGLPKRIVGLQELILKLPYLPLLSLELLATLTLPVAAAAGWFVGRRRDSRREGILAAELLLAGGALGLVFEIVPGLAATTWVIIYTTTAIPVIVYAEGVYRRDDGVAGFLFPVVLVGGSVIGILALQALGFSGPESWLDWAYLTSAPDTSPELAGIYPALVGSVMILIVVIALTFPVGVGAALYLEEYAPSGGLAGRFVTLIEINIANLAGVPSVVYGLLGLGLFINRAQLPGGSVIVGGLAVGLLILPIIIISAQEAIDAVPDSLRQASYGMGATRWQTTRQVVLPEALPGIMTGTILGLGRAIGETAPLLLVGVAASVRFAPAGFFDKTGAMPRQIFTWAFEPKADFRYGVLAAGVVTLIAVLLVMNATAIIVRNKYQRDA